MLLHNIHVVTPMLAETMKHCSENADNGPIIPRENVIRRRRRGICAPKVMYRLQPIVRVIFSLYFHKTFLCFINSLTIMCNFDALASNNKETLR